MTPEIDILIKLGLSILLGGLLGVEREKDHKPAGVRTYILVCMGTTLLISIVADTFGPTDALSRVIQGLITGLGFIGAGAIMRTDTHHVHGLTTAASIWTVAMIGIAVGLGYFWISVIATLLILLLLKMKLLWSGPPPDDN